MFSVEMRENTWRRFVILIYFDNFYSVYYNFR